MKRYSCYKFKERSLNSEKINKNNFFFFINRVSAFQTKHVQDKNATSY